MERLKELGLTEYENQVYQTLLSTGTATGGRIAKESGVPHGKTYQSLQSLSEKGFVTIVPVKPKLFKANAPRQAVEAFAQKRKEQITNLTQTIISSITRVPETKAPKIRECVTVMENTRQVMNHVVTQCQNAQKEISILSRGEKIPAHTFRAVENAIKKGTPVRLIVFELDGNRKDLQEFANAGLQLRYLPDYKLTFIITDQSEVQVVIRDPKNLEERIGIVFENQALARMLYDLFETLWAKAKPIKL